MNATRTVMVAWFVISVGLLSESMVSPLAAQEAPSADKQAREKYVASLPKDVHPDSGNRLPLIKREELDEELKKVYDATTSNPNTVAGVRGPNGIRMRSAGLMRSRGRETAYLRYQSTIGRRHVELAILLTARAFDAQFEWTLHELEGLEVGLEQAVIDVVKHNKPLTGLNEKDAALIQLGRETFGKTTVSSETFARALQAFGQETLVEIVALMGQSAATAVLLHTFDQQLPPGQEPLLVIP
ncbi:MAG: carboxymuconolactone decarboxylase family protein [Terriglobia bacterium]